jgi:hypothetical protein
VTTDGHRAYLDAIDQAFGIDVDYAQLIKLYGETPHPAGRYCPAQIQGTKTHCCQGNRIGGISRRATSSGKI